MNEVRIASGVFRGRKITTPGGKTHPMGEREKIALFNMIQDYIPGSRVLDAYAGSGALGIEALSRGASSVEFLEKNQTAIKAIRKNLQSLDLKERIFAGDATNFTTNDGFDLILADPPYDNFDVAGVEYLSGFLKNGGIMVLSHPFETVDISSLKLLKTRKYAASHISVYAKI